MTRELFIEFSKTKELENADFEMKTVIRKAVSAVLDYFDFWFPCEVSVTLCDNEYIHTLNKRFRNIDRATDVLSFPLYDDGDIPEEDKELGVILGDIVISLERALEQAGEIGNTLHEEVAFLTVHSMLHLLGYDHERSKEEDELQCRLQREIIKTVEF